MTNSATKAVSSTNNAVADPPSTVVYLAQYEYADEPGSFWPSKAFTLKSEAEKFVNRINCQCGNRFYQVVPLILESV